MSHIFIEAILIEHFGSLATPLLWGNLSLCGYYKFVTVCPPYHTKVCGTSDTRHRTLDIGPRTRQMICYAMHSIGHTKLQSKN